MRRSHTLILASQVTHDDALIPRDDIEDRQFRNGRFGNFAFGGGRNRGNRTGHRGGSNSSTTSFVASATAASSSAGAEATNVSDGIE